MSYRRRILSACALLALSALPLRAQQPESRALTTFVGAGAGVLGGGYVSLTIIVLEARTGRYIHDVNDVLGWRSTPVLLGAGIGAGLGAYSPDRLAGAVIYGGAGLGAGALIGAGLGAALLEGPEGTWAGAAIGAGFGLVIGNVIGMLRPPGIFEDGDEATPLPASRGIPLTVRIPF